jgi:hypothetical protein
MRNYKGSMNPIRTLVWTNEITVLLIYKTTKEHVKKINDYAIISLHLSQLFKSNVKKLVLWNEIGGQLELDLGQKDETDGANKVKCKAKGEYLEGEHNHETCT